MSRHGANYRGNIASPNAYPTWSIDEDNAAAVQRAMLNMARKEHMPIRLGASGDSRDGVDGSWRGLSQAAWNSFTPDQQREILIQAQLGHEAPAPSAQVSTAPTLGSLRATAAVPSVTTQPSAQSQGEIALLADADKALAAAARRPLPADLRTAALATPSDPSIDTVNASILHYARQHQGTKYDLYNQNGGVNCSTFVARALTAASRDAGQPMAHVDGTSEQQICSANGVSENTRLGFFRGDDLRDPSVQARLQPGMVIGIGYDHKKWGFEAGRANGMAHIGVVVRDERGQLSVAASDGGKGVEVTPINQWIDLNSKYDPSGARYYVAQPFTRMAQAPQAPQTQLAQATQHNRPMGRHPTPQAPG